MTDRNDSEAALGLEEVLRTWARAPVTVEDGEALRLSGVDGTRVPDGLFPLARVLRLGHSRGLRDIVLRLLLLRLDDIDEQEDAGALVAALEHAVEDAASDLRGDPRGRSGEPTQRHSPPEERPDLTFDARRSAACRIALHLDDLATIQRGLAWLLHREMKSSPEALSELAKDIEHVLIASSSAVEHACDCLSQEEVDAIAAFVADTPRETWIDQPHMLALARFDFESWWLPRSSLSGLHLLPGSLTVTRSRPSALSGLHLLPGSLTVTRSRPSSVLHADDGAPTSHAAPQVSAVVIAGFEFSWWEPPGGATWTVYAKRCGAPPGTGVRLLCGETVVVAWTSAEVDDWGDKELAADVELVDCRVEVLPA